MSEEVLQEEPVVEVDVYANENAAYAVVKQDLIDGINNITIDVDGYKTVVRDPKATTVEELQALCARTAQQVRYNKAQAVPAENQPKI